MRDEDKNNGSKLVNKVINKFLKMKIIGIILSGILGIVFVGALFAILLNGIAAVGGYLSGLFSNQNPDTGEIDRSKKTFANALLDREDYWLTKDIQIDKELVLSIALYSQTYTREDDAEVPCDDPSSDECIVEGEKLQRSKELIKDVKRLADGMVKERHLYYCQNKIVEQETVCGDDGKGGSSGGGGSGGQGDITMGSSSYYNFSLVNLNNNQLNYYATPLKTVCWQEEKISWAEPLVCGFDDETLCNSVCTEGYKSYYETVYQLKTKQEYINWLKLPKNEKDEWNQYGYDMEEKLLSLKFSIPSNEVEKEKYLDEKIEDMYAIYYTIRGTRDYFSDIMDPYGGDYTQWKQKNPAWANNMLGTNPGSTIGNFGCLATSLAIQIARSGTFINYDYLGAESFNPGTFIGRIRQDGAFTAGGNYKWYNIGTLQVAPNFIYQGQIGLTGSWEDKLAVIHEQLEQGHFLILSVNFAGHWVAVTGIENNDVSIIDPGGRDVHYAAKGYGANTITGIAIYKKLD